MNSTAGRKDIFYIVVLILTFIIVVIGATFAIFTYLKNQEEGSSAVYTGTLSIDYIDGNIISLNLLRPIYEPSYEETENVYKNNFKVSSTGSLDSLLDIKLNLNKNEFSDEMLMYNLYDGDGNVVSTGNIDGVGTKTIASNLELKNKEVNDYTLIIWLNENDENQNKEMRKSLTGTISVDANQKIE